MHPVSLSGDVILLVCQNDFGLSPTPASLVSFESTPTDVPACQIWWS